MIETRFCVFFIVPGYVVLAIAFGTIDPIFRSPVPEWNPLHWSFGQFTFVFDRLAGPGGYFGELSLIDGGPRTARSATSSPGRKRGQ
jgi:ABC-type glycerol-3-phosphate transport system permease component